MNVIHAGIDPGFQQWKLPALAIAISALLHTAIWSVWIKQKPQSEPVVTPPQIIEVALIRAPPTALPEPQKPQVQAPPAPPKPKPQAEKPPEKPAPKKPEKPKPRPMPKPAPQPESEPAPVPETAASPATRAPTEAPAASAPASPAAPSPAPFVEANYKSPTLHNPPTRYPRLALERQWEGTVTLRVRVLANGSAGEIRIERSSGHELLDESTIEQVRDWRFAPARKGNQAVDSWVVIPIEYKLKR